MSGHFRLFAAVAVLVLAGVPASVRAAPQPEPNRTFPFPASAPIVIHVHGLERTKDRLTKMLAALPPAEAEAVAKSIDEGFQIALTGRTLKAIPRDGSIFIVIHDIERLRQEDVPPISVLVPVTGYKEFRETFLTAAERKTFEAGANRVDVVKMPFKIAGDDTVYMVDLKDYVALTIDRAIAEKYAGKYARAQSASMGPELAATFTGADISLYANMEVINETHREDIRNFKELLEFTLKQAEMGEGIPGLDKKQLEAARGLLGTAFQGIEDCRAVVLAAEFRPEGLGLRAQAHFAEGTPTNQLLKSETPTPLDGLARLPAGMSSYSGMWLGPKIGPLGRSLNRPFQPAAGDAAGAALIDKLEAEIAAAGPGAEFTATKSEATLHVTAFENPKAAAAAYTKLYRGLAAGAKIDSVVLKEPVKVVDAAQNHRGFTCTEVRLTFDLEASVAHYPEPFRPAALAMLKRSAREEMTTWVGTDGKVVVRLSAKDWPAARKLLDAYLDGTGGVGSEAGFQLTRKNLPTDATVVRLFETRDLIVSLVELFRALSVAAQGEFPIPQVKPPPGEPTYIGVALTLKPQTATVDVFVPGTSMNVAAQMLVPLFKNID